MSLKKTLEQRTLGSSANIPNDVFNRVLIRLKDESPFFKHSTFILSTDRDRITVVSDIGNEAFEVVNLDLKELRETMKVSSEIYNNNEDIEIYLEEKIYTKIIESMEADFARELSKAPGTANKVTFDNLTINSLLKMKQQLKTSYLKEAVWIMDRKTYDTLSLTLISDKPLIKSDIKNGFVELTMLGHYVYVVDTISEDVNIVFANLRRGFVVRVLNEISVKKLAEIGYSEGAQIYALNTMYCGKVVETAAIVQGKFNSSTINLNIEELQNSQEPVYLPESKTKNVEELQNSQEPVHLPESKTKNLEIIKEKPVKKTRGRKKKEDSK